jgi:ABC-type bacteriocin/lantibiotic exporter with double-glycine peptidase domain
LAQLAGITGSEFNEGLARVAVQNASQKATDPLSQLVSAAAEVYMRVSPIRIPLAEAIWQARHDAPVVIWHKQESRWLVITHAGLFCLRLADGEHLTHRVTITRKELVRKLGCNGLDAVVEAAIVHPERTAHSMSSHAHGAARVNPAIRFFALLKAERQDIRTLLIFSMFSGILYLAAPLAVDAVVSNLAFGGQSQPYIQALIVLSIALFACMALQAVVIGLQYYTSDIIQRRLFVRTASDLAYRLPRVKAESLDGSHTPELVNRFLDIVTLQKSTSLLLLDGVNLVFSAFIGMILLSLYHPLLLMFVVGLLVLIVLTIWLLGHGAVETSIRESVVKYDLVNWFEEIAHFPFLFKGPGGYDLAYERANQLATDYIRARSNHFRILIRQIAGLLGLQVLAGATLLAVGGYLVISQQITLGQLVASELIMGSIVAALAKMGKKLEAWYDAMAAMDKLGHIFDLEIEREDGERPEERKAGAHIKAESLAFGYNDIPVLAGLNFTIVSGSRVAIVGPHGSGGSTTLDILFGLRQPTSGCVVMDGLDLRNWYLESLREKVMLLRRGEIVDGSITENLRLGRTDIGLDEIRQALIEVGLHEEILLRPEGLNLKLKIGGDPLSGNQRTRLLFARALVQRPKLLLVDELFDGLDTASLNQLSNVILRKSKDWTVVLTSRDPDVIQKCDQIIKLRPSDLADDSCP